jgi:hypothetical protein
MTGSLKSRSSGEQPSMAWCAGSGRPWAAVLLAAAAGLVAHLSGHSWDAFRQQERLGDQIIDDMSVTVVVRRYRLMWNGSGTASKQQRRLEWSALASAWPWGEACAG